METINAQGGLLLSGHFRCERLLKQGAGVDTWMAADLADGDRNVVVKTVSATGVSPATRIRLEHEAQVLRRLDALSVRPLLEWGRDDGTLYLVQP